MVEDGESLTGQMIHYCTSGIVEDGESLTGQMIHYCTSGMAEDGESLMSLRSYAHIPNLSQKHGPTH